jgi:hypothetical protein
MWPQCGPNPLRNSGWFELCAARFQPRLGIGIGSLADVVAQDGRHPRGDDMRIYRAAGLAGVTAAFVLAAATAAVAQTTSSTTAPTTTTTSLEPTTTTASLEPTTTTAQEPVPSPPTCQQLFAGPASQGYGEDVRPLGAPVGRSVRVRLSLDTGATSTDVRICVLVRSSRGGQMIASRTTGFSGPSEEGVLTVQLPAAIPPGSLVCAQAGLVLGFSTEDLEEPFEVAVSQTDRSCLTVPARPTGGSDGELPFTGPGRGVPLAAAATLALIGTGAALLRRFGRDSDEREPGS